MSEGEGKTFSADILMAAYDDVRRADRLAAILDKVDRGPSIITDVKVAWFLFRNPLKVKRFTSSVDAALWLVGELWGINRVDISSSNFTRQGSVRVKIYKKTKDIDLPFFSEKENREFLEGLDDMGMMGDVVASERAETIPIAIVRACLRAK